MLASKLQKCDSNPGLADFNGVLLTIIADCFTACLHKDPVIRYVFDVLTQFNQIPITCPSLWEMAYAN